MWYVAFDIDTVPSDIRPNCRSMRARSRVSLFRGTVAVYVGFLSMKTLKYKEKFAIGNKTQKG